MSKPMSELQEPAPQKSEQASVPARGLSISGKRFVAPFVLTLAVLLAFTLAIAFQFQFIMRRLDDARSCWPPASAALAPRYTAIDRWQSSAENLPEDWRVVWRQEFEAFMHTAQYDRQMPHAARLEELAQRLAQDSSRAQSLPVPSTFPSAPAIDRWLATEQRRIANEQGWLGRCTMQILRLHLTAPYQPHP
ncbi:MAG: hypothetical protein ACK5OB_01995 [Pirellula sp.]